MGLSDTVKDKIKEGNVLFFREVGEYWLILKEICRYLNSRQELTVKLEIAKLADKVDLEKGTFTSNIIKNKNYSNLDWVLLKGNSKRDIVDIVLKDGSCYFHVIDEKYSYPKEKVYPQIFLLEEFRIMVELEKLSGEYLRKLE